MELAISTTKFKLLSVDDDAGFSKNLLSALANEFDVSLAGNASEADAQTMYGLESRSEKKSNKVLIFKNADARFGLVVDSVEAIISINNEAKVRLPDILYSNVGSMAEDVVEAIQSKDSSGVNQNLLILNSSSIAKRIKTAG